MQLLKHSFPKILFFTLFPLAFSLISYLIETFFISYFRSSSEFSIEENRSILESQFPFGIALLKNLRGFLMSSYYSYFHFMGMMLILHIVSMIFQKVLLLLKKEFPQSQEKSDSPPQTPMKLFQSLIYFTISYYLCHLLIPNIHSMSLTPSLPQLENISPYNPHSQPSRILEAEEIHQKPHQNQSLIPQEISPYLFEIRTPKSNSQDPLPLIARDKGALAVVVSKDGKKLFRLTEQISGPHTISAADISDAFTVKDSPSYTMNLEFCYQTLAISNDSSTLFVIDCAKFHVFNVSEVRSPPKLISSVQFAEWNSSSRNRSRNYNHKPSVALYEEENAIIIVNNGLHIYNLTDIENPTRIYENKTFPLSPVTIVSKQKKALFGGKNGLIAYNISDLTNPKPLNLKLNLWKDQFIFTIHLSNDEKMVHIGALIPTQNNDTQIKIYALLLKNTQDMSIEETVKVDGLSSCRATSSLLPDSVLPDFKIAHDTNYLYWACGKDYGYFDTSDPKLVTFTSVAPINAIALAHNSRIFLRVDSEQINLFALYQNIQRNESFIWKPNFGHSLKLSPNISHVIIPKMADRLYFVNQTSDNKTILQSYSTRLGVLIQGLSLEIPAKPLFCLASDDGKFLYMKMDPKTIHIALFENSQRPRLLIPITFPEPIDDKFVASSDNKFLIVTKTSKFLGDSVQAAIYTVNMSAPSSSKIKQLVLNADSKDDKQVRYFSQLMLSKDSKTLYIQSAVLYCYNITDLNNPKFLKSRSVTSIVGDTRDSFILSPDEKTAYVMTENIDYQSYKRLVFIDIEKYITPAPFFFMPNLAGNLPIQVSSNGNFLYISTPEHLMEVNITQKSAPFFSRLMKVNMKQFALSKDGKSMYAVIGDRFEIIDLRTKHSLISFKEDFPLGASYTVELKLLQANHIKSYDPVYSNHRFLTTYFFKSSFSHLETEPILSYVVTPTWIHFDKDTSRLTLEPRLPSHLGTYKIYATGSLQVPSDELFESIPTLKKTANDPENILTDLVDRGYLDEDLFITAKFNATRKLLLSPQYSQFEKDIRYFLRDYMTGQEFAFTVSSSLSFEISPSTVKIESLSPHHVVVHIYLRKNHKDLEKNEICQFVQRTYSTPRSILNDPQTLLILDGPLLNINNALQEIIVNFKEPGVKVQALITVFDNMNPSARFELDDVSRYFNLNTKPIPNPSLLIQTQVNKQPLVANRPFSIALHPDSYFDPNNRSLEYTLDTKLDWLDLRGLSLAGTPPKKLLPEKVDITITISNEFKSEKLTFTLEIGYSGIVLIQYIIVYFGYVFSAYKGYAHFHRFYNVVAQRKYRYPKVHVVSVDQEVTDQTMTPVGFFGKEYENANLLMQYLENYIRKNPKYKNFTREKFADYFGETSSRHDLSKKKLIKTINLMLEGLTFFERHSVKYYIQVSEEIQDTIHQIIFDQIILTEIYHPDERETLKVFNKIKDQWIDIVEPSAWWQFAVNKSKLELAIQNIGASSKKAATYYSGENGDDSITKKNELLDISDNNVRSRYLSNSHVVFNRKISTVEAPLLSEKIAVSPIPEDINMELLEVAMKAYAFQSHHINAHREQVTIVSKERMVGSSWFFKLKALLRFHLNELKSANKEDLGYGLKYMFHKNVLHFYGIPEASMEYDTLVVQVLNKREMIMREIYIFGAERQNHGKEQIEPIQEQL